jgi:hypothetical protein
VWLSRQSPAASAFKLFRPIELPAGDEMNAKLIPAGYLAKRVCARPDGFSASHVVDIYSVSSCISENFADYIQYWKHNGFWLFDSPEIIQTLAKEHSIPLEGTSLFYFEVFDQEFDRKRWQPFEPESSFATNVIIPSRKQLEGFDVVTFSARTNPECSRLSCNSMAAELATNAHGLFPSFKEAESNLTHGACKDSEPGPHRIFAVYSVNWP